jgi:hypothetical protein
MRPDHADPATLPGQSSNAVAGDDPATDAERSGSARNSGHRTPDRPLGQELAADPCATGDNPVYQVGGRSFIFFRNPRPDAIDPDTGERYADVIVFWVVSEADKQALVQDEASPLFTTAHFDGHPSVLLRASRVGELTRKELAEVIQDAWLSHG